MIDTEKRYKEILKRCYEKGIIRPTDIVVNYLKNDNMEWSSIYNQVNNRNLESHISIFYSSIYNYIYEDKLVSSHTLEELMEKINSEHNPFIKRILNCDLSKRQRTSFENTYSKYNKLTRANPVLVKDIDYDSMPDISFEKEILVKITNNIKNDIEDIIELCNNNHNRILLNNLEYSTTRAGARRSAMDIYLLLKHYGATYTLQEIIDALESLVEERTLSTWICGGIGRRVYWMKGSDSHTWDNSDDNDEFNNFI